MCRFKARKISALNLPMPPRGRTRGTLKRTVLEDEFRMAAIG
jgi:hypothetical protein